MQDLKTTLQHKLKGATRVAILGVGSNIMGDDIAGMLVAEKVEEGIKARNGEKVKIFFGGTAPENLTGDLKQFIPSHLIIIDSADFKKEPGYVGFIELDKIGGMSFCTHRLPLKIMADYLLQSLPKLTIILLCIQPKSMRFGEEVSMEVQKAIDELSNALLRL